MTRTPAEIVPAKPRWRPLREATSSTHSSGSQTVRNNFTTGAHDGDPKDQKEFINFDNLLPGNLGRPTNTSISLNLDGETLKVTNPPRFT